MFVAFVVTYIAFSWLIVKGHRYTLYMMIPASFLLGTAVRDLMGIFLRKSSARSLVTAVAVAALAVSQNLAVSAYAPYVYLTGMGSVAQNILDKSPNASILYSGRNDAAFVFYLRSLDTERRAQVFRASVQVTRPDTLARFIQEQSIEFIAVEVHNPGYDQLKIIDQFRDSILEEVQDSHAYNLIARFELPFGVSAITGHVQLHIYRRTL